MPNCYCLNPACSQPENPPEALKCRACGSALLIRNRYRAFKRIGQGGFGATFLARDQDMPSKPWRVIKQLRPADNSPQIAKLSQELFNREAEVLEKLGEHSQIPKLFAHFEESEKFYLVQEFIQGGTLSHELHRNGPMSEDQVKQVLQEILLILSYVHSHNTVHRDIKPANLIRRKSDQRLVLIDFGAVKQLGPSKESPAEMTAIRSLGFSPPEQVTGQAVVPASDIYALGATCLNLLTMESPAKFLDPELNTWNWAGRIQLSDDFEFILTRMLCSSVNERFGSATEVLRSLQGSQHTLFIPRQLEQPEGSSTIKASDHWRSRPMTTNPGLGTVAANRSNPIPTRTTSTTGFGVPNRPSPTPPRVPSLARADLRDRSMSGQNLAGYDLRKADIRGADLSSANLQRADLRGVLFNTPQPTWVRILTWIFGQAKTLGGVAIGLFSFLGGAILSFWVVQLVGGPLLLSMLAGLGGAGLAGFAVWSFAGHQNFKPVQQPRKRYTSLRRTDLRGAQMDDKFRHFAVQQKAILDR